MRPTILSLVTLLAFSSGVALAQGVPLAGAVHIPKADVDSTLERAPKSGSSDQEIRTVDMGAYNVGVALVHRAATPGPQGALSHTFITEIYHVLKGSGTLVTGGTLVDPKPSPSDSFAIKTAVGPSISGRAIDGGESRKIGPGDIVIIGPGVPHWFSHLDSDITFLEFRTDPNHVLESPYYIFENGGGRNK